MDVNKLKGKIIEKGLNVDCVSKEIGIDRSTFYRKLRKGHFTIGEAKAIAGLLKLTSKESSAIFFNNIIASVRH